MTPELTKVELELAVAVIRTGFTVACGLLSLLITLVAALFFRLERKADKTLVTVIKHSATLAEHGARLTHLERER